eukprot:2709350-Rhodomonas_salina.1
MSGTEIGYAATRRLRSEPSSAALPSSADPRHVLATCWPRAGHAPATHRSRAGHAPRCAAPHHQVARRLRSEGAGADHARWQAGPWTEGRAPAVVEARLGGNGAGSRK